MILGYFCVKLFNLLSLAEISTVVVLLSLLLIRPPYKSISTDIMQVVVEEAELMMDVSSQENSSSVSAGVLCEGRRSVGGVRTIEGVRDAKFLKRLKVVYRSSIGRWMIVEGGGAEEAEEEEEEAEEEASAEAAMV